MLGNPPDLNPTDLGLKFRSMTVGTSAANSELRKPNLMREAP